MLVGIGGSGKWGSRVKPSSRGLFYVAVKSFSENDLYLTRTDNTITRYLSSSSNGFSGSSSLILKFPLHANYYKGQEGPNQYYAQVERSGEFFGVWATIETPDPVTREPVFSYASINIISPDGKWIEAGVNKGIYGYTDCIPKFSYAVQPGSPWIVSSPAPTVGVAYQYMIEKISDGHWFFRIVQTNEIVIFNTAIDNPGMNYGTKIQAAGEVNSPAMLNDMGVAGLLSLKWRMTNGSWSYWNGWTKGVE